MPKEVGLKRGVLMIALVAIVLLASCRTLPKRSLHEKQSDAKEVLRIGMSLEEAEKAMAAIGFECKVFRSESLILQGDSEQKEPTILTGVDYLNCVTRERRGLVTGILSVKLLLEDDLVKDFYYVWLFDGP
ncbi:MAG: hypothetical protein ACKO81_08435 [Planctomycetota bacterium]